MPPTITITTQQLWEILSFHSSLSEISLVNHLWLVDLIKQAGTTEQLYVEGGIHLDERIPTVPLLYSANSWKEQKERERQIDETSKQFRAERAKLPPADTRAGQVVSTGMSDSNQPNSLDSHIVAAVRAKLLEKKLDSSIVDVILRNITANKLKELATKHGVK